MYGAVCGFVVLIAAAATAARALSLDQSKGMIKFLLRNEGEISGIFLDTDPFRIEDRLKLFRSRKTPRKINKRLSVCFF